MVSAPVFSGMVGGSFFFIVSSDSFSSFFSPVTWSELRSSPTTTVLLRKGKLGWLVEAPSALLGYSGAVTDVSSSDSETNEKKKSLKTGLVC